MNDKEIKRLIDAYLSGSISEHDRFRLETWYASFEEEEGLTKHLPEDDRKLLEQKIWDQVRSELRPAAKAAVPVLKWYRKLQNIAAVLAGCLVVTAAVAIYLQRRPVVRTAYGEIKSIMLPDSSVVVLNGNSRLRYSRSWGNEQPREVWIEGEAFFSVTHKRTGQEFIVHTSDNMNVQVLGTEFNVSNREKAVEVVLSKGSIHLQYNEKDTLTMVPGSYVKYQKETALLESRTVRSEHYSSWIDKKEYFDNTSLGEVAALLETTYGYKVEFMNKSLERKRVTGSMPVANMKSFVKALSGAVNLHISLEGKHITIGEPDDN